MFNCSKCFSKNQLDYVRIKHMVVLRKCDPITSITQLQYAALFHNERSSPAAKQLASVARKMEMREIPHCCQ